MSEQADDATRAIDTGQVNAEEFARNLASMGDEQLDELMSGPLREQILAEVFKRRSTTSAPTLPVRPRR